jgi:hypothetical protein
MLAAFDHVPEDMCNEGTVSRRKASLRDKLDDRLGAPAEADEVIYVNQSEIVISREGFERRSTHHGAVGVHQFAKYSGGREAGEPDEIARGLRVPATLQYAPLSRAQREHVAGADEVLRRRLVTRESSDRGGPVGGGDPGAGPLASVDAYRERRSMRVVRSGDHRWKVERIAAFSGQSDANQAARVPQEERERLDRGPLGREDQVPFVLAIAVVDDDHGLAPSDSRDGVFYACGAHDFLSQE